MPAWLAPAIAGGVSLLGKLFDNKQAKNMYQRQYNDNVRFWNMQNMYNAPVNQMSRLSDAGLNPNLVYGGSPGSTSGNAGSINTPNLPPGQLMGFENIGLDFLNSMYSLESKEAEVDKLKAQKVAILSDAALKAANTDRAGFDLDLARHLREYTIEGVKEGVRKTQADIRYTLGKNEREAVMTSQNIQESMQRILSMKIGRAKTGEEIKNLKAVRDNLWKDSELKQLDIDLKRQGIWPQDGLFARVVGRMLPRYINLDTGELTSEGRSLLHPFSSLSRAGKANPGATKSRGIPDWFRRRF